LTPIGGERWQRAPSVFTRAAGGEVLVLTPALEAPYRLDGAGAAVWHALAQPHTIAEVAAQLGRRFAVPADRVAADITPLVADLAACGALTPVG
jgi:hypothetical protein